MRATYTRRTRRYKVEKRGGNALSRYALSIACNCVLGPHWHVLSWHRTVAGAEDTMDIVEQEAQRKEADRVDIREETQ